MMPSFKRSASSLRVRENVGSSSTLASMPLSSRRVRRLLRLSLLSAFLYSLRSFSALICSARAFRPVGPHVSNTRLQKGHLASSSLSVTKHLSCRGGGKDREVLQD